MPTTARTMASMLCWLAAMGAWDDAERMRVQCSLWARWLNAEPASPGMPCFHVSSPSPQDVFVLPGAKPHDDGLEAFQPLSDLAARQTERHLRQLRRRLATDTYLLGGTGPVPDAYEYLKRLRDAAPGRPLHLVQIGANQGGGEGNEWVHAIMDDNPTWTATVVEPVPHIFQLLERNYLPERHRVEAIQAALAPVSKPCEMMAAPPGNLHEVSTLALGNMTRGVRCFTRGRRCSFHKWMAKRGDLQKIVVPCLTLPDLLARRRLSRHVPVDVLVIDTEMFDYTLITSGALQLREVRPLMIEFESKAFTAQQGAEVAVVLALQGYLCRFSPWDTFRKRLPKMRGQRNSARLAGDESVCFRMV